MGRSHYGVGRNKIIGLPEVVRVEERETQKGAEYNHETYYVFNRVVSMKRNFIRVTVNPERVVTARGV